ncbi:hypothetical protein NCU08764 [Neurospora crassa OR74A]|uniref:Uncharacterized protein n=1 Tax=Neurospora crassa (strain ATCC 24698 / 74-OR23-1A / CBS 708.71 / DSM 1257 / FGSC 987) TaxID=367110 RepID=Q1K4V3_NEUCR|nr:hypothetical protein NCU08764 [Neurospora crassa OR74A]EAA26877.2 hypothetical protein NCU08764 [Neurospora crassa OR74A]|eukprot:XP_956113.2 hypothetical protein NCU08764 [Neurospora crassa OR74A]
MKSKSCLAQLPTQAWEHRITERSELYRLKISLGPYSANAWIYTPDHNVLILGMEEVNFAYTNVCNVDRTATVSTTLRKLPSELIQQVLNHFIDDLPGDHDIDWRSEDEIPRDELPQPLDPWTKYRHIPLFSCQKRRIERHYRDHWLSRITIYLYLDPNMYSTSRRMLYCRYLSCPEGKDLAMALPEVEFKEGGDGGAEADAEEKVTFFLRGAVRSARENSNGETSKREFGNVPEILPRVENTWAKVLKGKTERLGLTLRTKEQTLESGPEDNLWTRESEVVLKSLEVLDHVRRVQFNWKKLMSKVLLKFGLYNGYTYVPEPGVDVSEDEDWMIGMSRNNGMI